MNAKLLFFYVITFVFTVVLAVSQQSMGIDFEKIVIPQFAPTIAFLITVLIFPALKIPLNFSTQGSIFGKFVIAFFSPVFLFLLGFYLGKCLGLNLELTTDLTKHLPIVVGGMLIGAVGEEIGWRGFLQANLEKKYAIVPSSILVGLLWGLWHIGHYKNGILFMLGFLLFTISASIILRFLLQKSKNNLIISILFHFSINLGFFVFYKSSLSDPNMILTNGIIWLIPAMTIIVFNKITE